MGGIRVTKLFFPKALSEREHLRIRQIIANKMLSYDKDEDDCLLECGLTERKSDSHHVVPRVTEDGHDFYYVPGTTMVNFFWLSEQEWCDNDEEL